MIKDLEEAHQTVNMLLDEMNEICSAFPDPIKEKVNMIIVLGVQIIWYIQTTRHFEVNKNLI